MTQMVISPFVNIVNEKVAAENDLVLNKIDYPVFAIDVVELEDESTDTLFLIANQKGEFVWVSVSDVKRAQMKKPVQQKYKPNI